MTVDVRTQKVDSEQIFDRSGEIDVASHELVVYCRDRETDLRAIISVHDTTLGPSLGGTRFRNYRNEGEALTDGLRLAEGMTYKAAAAGLPLGGGKAVIIGDPTVLKTPELLRAYGRFIETLDGRYITAADVGTTSADLDIIGETTNHVVGRTSAAGGSGDSGFSTAYGVFCAMKAAARHTWGESGLQDRTVGVEGAGKVGFHLIGLLKGEGAEVIVADPYQPALDRLLSTYSNVVTAASVIDRPLDVYAPCALGATLTLSSAAVLSAQIVCGAANNQLATVDVGDSLAAREVVWVPDFVANAGGLIQVGGELQNRTEDEVRRDVEHVGTTVDEIISASLRKGISTADAAMAVVRARLSRAESN